MLTALNARWSPWKYAGGGVIDGSDGKMVAYLAGRMNDGNADVAGNVMAAAPELYHALQAFLSANHGQIEHTFADEAAQARRALAKARGAPP